MANLLADDGCKVEILHLGVERELGSAQQQLFIDEAPLVVRKKNSPWVGEHDGFSLHAGVRSAPSIARQRLARPGGSLLVSADLTLIPGREGTQWMSIGTRAAFPSDANALWLPYVEVGMYALANLGVGMTLAPGAGQKTTALPHLFVGLPFGEVERSAWYIEPYYRPCFGRLLGQGGAHHELGVLFKFGYLAPRHMRLCC